jgi:hypothetical protein
MGIEYRNGKPYFYRKRRKGGKVISEYAGSGALAEIIALLEEENQDKKENRRQAQKKKEAKYKRSELELTQLQQITNELFTSVALANGYHKPKRQWRKKRQK